MTYQGCGCIWTPSELRKPCFMHQAAINAARIEGIREGQGLEREACGKIIDVLAAEAVEACETDLVVNWLSEGAIKIRARGTP